MGLGACLMQHGQLLEYASWAMTKAEVNYAQIEKELLAIVFGLDRLEQYVQGRPVKIETDHKPLESIFKRSLISALKLLQRMMLRLQKYHLKVMYKKGSEAMSTRIRKLFFPQIFFCGCENFRAHTQRIQIVFSRPHVSDCIRIFSDLL